MYDLLIWQRGKEGELEEKESMQEPLLALEQTANSKGEPLLYD